MRRFTRGLKHTRHFTSLALLAGAFLLAFAPLHASTPVTCGANLNVVAAHYILTANLSCSTNPAVQITANGADFNLAGFTLSGPGSAVSTGVGILIFNATGVHVEGGTVTGYSLGIELDGSGLSTGTLMDNHVNGMTISGNVTGILLLNANGNHINGDNISNNLTLGVRLTNSNGNQFNTNTITNNNTVEHDGGFALYNSSYNLITSNNVSNNGLVGIFLDPSSTFNTIRSCIANGQAGSVNRTGIYVKGDNNLIQGNTTNQNQYGIWLSGLDPNQVASNNTVQSNIALNNSIVDLRDDNICNNKWKNNTFVTSNDLTSCIQ